MAKVMSNKSNDPISEILLKYTAELMAGLDKYHFPREEQTKIFTKSHQAISKLLLNERLDEAIYWQTSINDEKSGINRIQELQNQLTNKDK